MVTTTYRDILISAKPMKGILVISGLPEMIILFLQSLILYQDQRFNMMEKKK